MLLCLTQKWPSRGTPSGCPCLSRPQGLQGSDLSGWEAVDTPKRLGYIKDLCDPFHGFHGIEGCL